MSRDPIPTSCFAVVVVRLGHRFLVVHERKHGQLFYLPAGRVEPGERFVDAAHRETREEAGLPIVLDGVLRIQHTPQPDGSARLRVVFVAHPSDDTPPKQIADDESLGARWVTVDEAAQLPLRGAEVLSLFREVAAGAPIYPLAILGHE